MNEIEFKVGGAELLDAIAPLWIKLNAHHADISPCFSDHFRTNEFDRRKLELIAKLSTGELRVEIAIAKKKDIHVGYSIGSISEEKTGEVDSIFVEEPFRKQGIADHLMKHVLNWMDQRQVKQKKVVVASGNESVFPFYEKYGFFPRTSTLIQKNSAIPLLSA